MRQDVQPPPAPTPAPGDLDTWSPAPVLPDEAASVDALRHQSQLLRQTIVLCDRLTGMALRGAGIASITAQFSQMIGHGVTVFDPMLAPLASAGWPQEMRSGAPGNPARGSTGPPPDEELPSNPLGWTITDERLRAALEAARAPVRLPSVPGAPATGGCVIAPVTVGARLLGYVAVASPEEPLAGDLDLFAVQHAATVYAQALLEEDRVGAFRLRFKREIFEALLRNHPRGGDEALESARLVGLNPDQPYQVAAIVAFGRGQAPRSPQTLDEMSGDIAAHAVGLSPQAQILDTVASALDHRFPNLVTVVQDDDLIVVAPPALESLPGGDGHLGTGLLAFLTQRFPVTTFTIGTSRVTTAISQLATAREQARRTLKMAQRLGRSDAVTAYDDLGFYRLLLAVPSPELRAFSDEVLGALLDYDATHHSDLVTTLDVYLQVGASPRHVAERLFVHPNTVVYRIGRIESVAGVDLAEADDRLLCRAALKARETLEDAAPPRDPPEASTGPPSIRDEGRR